ncbi:MAG: SDR family NAD(P)-dependent oxidoreductase [Dongiaceae bacterium]
MTGLTALITGASSGIGRELARLFAADGHDLVLVARRANLLEDLAGDLRRQFRITVRVWPEDLADHFAPRRIHQRAQAEGIVIDVLVNNAGFGALGPFADLPRDRQMAMIDVNLRALTELTHLFLASMVRQRRGRILNLASMAAFQAGPYMAVYYATKAYVLSFSEALSAELAGSGVSVTCLCPGLTPTEFQEVADMAGSRLAVMRGMSATAVARAGYDALMADRRLIVPGLKNKLGVFIVRFVPRGLAMAAVKWLQARRTAGQ